MMGGEVHAYKVTLAQGQYLRVIVEQKSIDAGIRISSPESQLLIEMDSPQRFQGPESVSVLAQAAGDYKIEVISGKISPRGSYEIKIEALREPTPADLKRLAAERALVEGQRLRFQETAESRKAAVEKYKEALALWQALGDVRWQAYTLCNMGRALKASGSLPDSLEYFNQAMALLRGAEDIAGQAFVLNEISAAYRDLGQPPKALEVYDQALALRRKAGDRWGEAQILNNIGIIYTGTGYQHKAQEKYQEALLLWRSVGDRYNETNTLNGLAGSYDELGELSQALGYLEQVLKFCEDVKFCHEVGNRDLEILAHNNMGKIYDAWGDPQHALDHYEMALDISRKLNNRRREALVLNNLGMVHAGLGDFQKGLEYLTDSLKIRQELKLLGDESIALTNIGYVYALAGDHREALRYVELAMPLSERAGNKLFVAYALTSMGMAHVSLNEPRKALDYYGQALKIQQEVGDRRGQAVSLDKIGQAYTLLGELPLALNSYGQALQHWITIGDKQGQALTLYGIASLERDRNNLVEARQRIEEAIGIVESLRTRLTSQQLRLTYFSNRQNYYELAIDVHMLLYERDRKEEDRSAALAISERARARNLLDMLFEARTHIRQGVDLNLVERLRELELELNSGAASLLRLRSLKRDEDAAAVEKRLALLTREYNQLQAQVRDNSRLYAELKQPQSYTLKEIQQRLLDDDTILLEYALGEKRSYLWAVTRSSISSYVLRGRDEIEKAAGNLRESMTAYEPPLRGESSLDYLNRLRQSAEKYRQQATDLSGLVLAPVAPLLKAKRLAIVADGALRFIPFEALPTPDGTPPNGSPAPPQSLAHNNTPAPLILKYEIIYEPSISALFLLRAAPREYSSKSVAVLADPVFSSDDKRVLAARQKPAPDAAARLSAKELSRALRDVGVEGDGAELERLDYTLKEAERVIATAPAGTGMKAVSFSANRQTAMSPELGRYRFVHLATHAILDDKSPELSGIVLSLVNEQGQPQNGYLRLSDIYNLKLPVDFVVLSACRTGIGKEVKGEGLIGLTRGFMYAGAARVLATLWKVRDDATAELMSRFYWHLMKGRLPAASALRRAQIDLMQMSDEWRKPFFWAGFVLQGDWK